MSSREIIQYYADTERRRTREDLTYAASMVSGSKIAVDCGCGACSDIAFRSELGFRVYAFDIEEESVSRCRNRFRGKKSFQSSTFPEASLVVGDSSQLFCRSSEFNLVWFNIYDSLAIDGIFIGLFLGADDCMAGSDYEREKIWHDVTVFG